MVGEISPQNPVNARISGQKKAPIGAAQQNALFLCLKRVHERIFAVTPPCAVPPSD